MVVPTDNASILEPEVLLQAQGQPRLHSKTLSQKATTTTIIFKNYNLKRTRPLNWKVSKGFIIFLVFVLFEEIGSHVAQVSLKFAM